MRFLITGGSGFIGSHLAAKLAENHEVTVLDRHPILGKANYNFIKADLLELDDRITEVLNSCDLIVHLASTVGVDEVSNNRIATINTIYEGTRKILNLAKNLGVPIAIASSSEVYGACKKLPFVETQFPYLGPPTEPRWCYATAKLLAEHLALAHAKEFDLPVIIFRPFNVIGPGQKTKGMVVPTFIDSAIAGKPMIIYGDGSHHRCFIDVRDAVAGIEKLCYLLYADGLKNVGIFNIGNPHNSISILELANTIGKLCGKEAIIAFDEQARTTDPLDRVPSISKIISLTDWTPRIPLEKTLKETIEWYQNQA